MRRYFRFIAYFMLVCLSSLTGLLIANSFLKRNKYSGNVLIKRIAANNRIFGCYLTDSLVIYRPRPNDSICSQNDAYGFRKSPDLPATFNKTILTLGDSFVYGAFVDSNQTYPAYLEKILNESGNQTRVYNAGVVGFGTDQEFLYFTSYILPNLKPNIVIWNIHENDPYDNIEACLIQYADNKSYDYKGYLNTLYILSRLNTSLPKSITQSDIYKLVVNSIPPRYTLGCTYKEQLKPRPQLIQKIMRTIRDMQELSKKYGFDLVLVYAQGQAGYNSKINNLINKQYNEEFLKIFEENGIYPINLKKEIRELVNKFEKSLGVSVNKDALDIDLFYMDDPKEYGDKHMNSKGYMLTAEVLANKIQILLDK